MSRRVQLILFAIHWNGIFQIGICVEAQHTEMLQYRIGSWQINRIFYRKM